LSKEKKGLYFLRAERKEPLELQDVIFLRFRVFKGRSGKVDYAFKSEEKSKKGIDDYKIY